MRQARTGIHQRDPGVKELLVRMGNAPDGYPVPYLLNDEIWARLNAVIVFRQLWNRTRDQKS
ncbi:MAG: hypothetical protein IPH21_14415 [Flavobacteriales bacterium]|nr:hypothetical protein [Flavobacteriales bacterium]